jgi:hypothetical protein
MEVGPVVLTLVGAGLQLIGVVVMTRQLLMQSRIAVAPWLRWLLRVPLTRSTRTSDSDAVMPALTGAGRTSSTAPWSADRAWSSELDQIRWELNETRVKQADQAEGLRDVRVEQREVRRYMDQQGQALQQTIASDLARASDRSAEIELRGAAWIIIGMGLVLCGGIWGLFVVLAGYPPAAWAGAPPGGPVSQ